MDGSIRLSPQERKRLFSVYRGPHTPAVRLRAHLRLLLADGHSWNLIVAILDTSSATISRWKKRFEAGGLDAVFGEDRGRSGRGSVMGFSLVVDWVIQQTPRDFGFLRSRWSCGTLVLLLRELPANETAVFEDEVDLNLNPKIGSMWMPRGEQATVVTPGNNVKRYLAGSLDWRTGSLIVSPPGTRRNAELFVAHRDELRRRLRCYQVIHVICDNAPFHDCRRVRQFLKSWGHRIQIQFIPTDSHARSRLGPGLVRCMPLPFR